MTKRQRIALPRPMFTPNVRPALASQSSLYIDQQQAPFDEGAHQVSKHTQGPQHVCWPWCAVPQGAVAARHMCVPLLNMSQTALLATATRNTCWSQIWQCVHFLRAAAAHLKPANFQPSMLLSALCLQLAINVSSWRT